MRFSRFRYAFLAGSGIGIVLLFAITFGVFGGFRPSISFNGGVRLSLVMPPGEGVAEINQALESADIQAAQVRVTDNLLNKYDVEFGPKLRDEIDQQLREEQGAKRDQIQELEEQGLPIPDELRDNRTVADYLTAKIVPLLGIEPSAVVSRESIAASYGANLFSMSLRLFAITVVAIGLYLSFRFDFPFAIGASIALIHDIVFTIGFIGVMQLEPSVPLVAAVLTIVGYSINDTIVIFDRIRENIGDRREASIEATVDLAITQTLSRTLITSILTLLSVLALILGGESSLRDFALVLLFGILIGTYSSIYVASQVVQIYESIRNRGRR